MEQPKQPIKRSAELAPLSRDHHEGLLLGWKLRQGMKKGVDAARMATFVKWFWQVHLVPHFSKEETFLPPVLPNSHQLMQQMLEEHVNIKAKVDRISDSSTYDDLEALAETVNQHIRFEERVLFNEVEKRATAEQLLQLLQQLTDDKVEEEWEDVFWK